MNREKLEKQLAKHINKLEEIDYKLKFLTIDSLEQKDEEWFTYSTKFGILTLMIDDEGIYQIDYKYYSDSEYFWNIEDEEGDE